tara:strand:- start:1002 stop:1217 length:216 start_codon:yes stop_codon:yes gene_type:complete
MEITRYREHASAHTVIKITIDDAWLIEQKTTRRSINLASMIDDEQATGILFDALCLISGIETPDVPLKGGD